MDKYIQKPKVKFDFFLKGFQEYEKQIKIKELRNKFLDAYLIWLKDKSRKSKLEVLRCALKLDAIDENFKISELFKNESV